MPGTVALSPDLGTIAANLGVFTAAIIAAVAGIYTGLKKINKGDPAPGDAKLPAGVIVETTTMLMWSESNKDVKLALEALLRTNESLTRSNYKVAEDMRDLCHCIELLSLRLERLNARRDD